MHSSLTKNTNFRSQTILWGGGGWEWELVSCPAPSIACGKSVRRNAYSILVLCSKIWTQPIRLQDGAYVMATFEKKKDCDSNLKEQTEDWLPLIQQVIDEANCCLSSAKCTQSLGEVRSLAVCMQTNFSAQFYCVSIIIRHRHQREPKLNTHFIRLSFPSPPNRKESLGSRLDKKSDTILKRAFYLASCISITV